MIITWSSFENLGEFIAGNIQGISVAAVRVIGNDHPQIKDNSIASLFSELVALIIRIDIQGDSKDTGSIGSIVDLRKNLFEDIIGKCIAVCVHEAVGGFITLESHKLDQETQILNYNHIHISNMKELHY